MEDRPFHYVVTPPDGVTGEPIVVVTDPMFRLADFNEENADKRAVTTILVNGNPPPDEQEVAYWLCIDGKIKSPPIRGLLGRYIDKMPWEEKNI